VTQHVVIVDDDDLTLKLFASIAGEISDVTVHPFRSSTEAIDWYHGKTVDCFVFDFNMPAPNGLQMIALVRALPEFALVPIVIVTGAHEREVRYQALDAGANDFLQKPVDYREMLARMTTLLALRAAQKKLAMQIGSLESSLLDAEERSRQHAERLEALWRIANNPQLRDDELMLAMLQTGAAAIRPGQPYRGTLGLIEDGQMRIISTAEGAGYADMLGPGSSRVGALVPVEDTIVAESLRAGGGTQSWDDLDAANHNTQLARAHGWRAMITTTFSAGGSTYVLSFASNQPTAKPFGPQDHAYIEVLASFFSTHYQQRWQSSRIGHQLEHDSLTGVWNRSRFRSLGRAAFRAGEPAAIAIVDLVRFHTLNETHGHLNGDAVLVEVAAALAAKAHEGEIVARVGGNSFAIFFPSAPAREWLLESIARFGSAFDVQMGIGDREGKESLPVSGRVGFAHAPVDGATFDELLLRAEGRARANAPLADQLTFP
jgi:diguanylate cyclase (GGDEF)-like protein